MFKKLSATSLIYIVIFLCILIVLGSYGFLLTQYLNPPPGKVYSGSFGFPGDFFGNLESMRKGWLGHWRHFPKLTSTLTGSKSFMKLDYLTLGQISHWFQIEPALFFHLTRLTLTIIFLLLSYQIICLIFKDRQTRLSAFILALFSTAVGWSKLMDFWTPLTVFQRAAYYPHYMLGFVLLLWTMILLVEVLGRRSWPKLLLAGLLGMAAALIHSPVIISLYLSFPFYLIITFWQMKDKRKIFGRLKTLLIFTLISCLPLIYFKKVSLVYPWNLVLKLDLLYSLNRFLGVKEVILGIGPTAILAVIGAWLAIKSRKTWLLILAPWSITYLIGFFWLGQIISANGIRFLQTPFFIFLGILSTLPLSKLAQKIRISPVWLSLLILVPSLGAYRQSLDINRYNFSRQFDYVFISTELKQAYSWLRDKATEKEIVLSAPNNSLLIVSLAGNWTYLTPMAEPLSEFPALKYNLFKFYCQGYDQMWAKNFLIKENISWVFYADEEKNLCPDQKLEYPFLIPVFTNSQVTIFKMEVKK
jgi:hypothetical protein